MAPFRAVGAPLLRPITPVPVTAVSIAHKAVTFGLTSGVMGSLVTMSLSPLSPVSTVNATTAPISYGSVGATISHGSPVNIPGGITVGNFPSGGQAPILAGHQGQSFVPASTAFHSWVVSSHASRAVHQPWYQPMPGSAVEETIVWFSRDFVICFL